jgi:hypothetical protein
VLSSAQIRVNRHKGSSLRHAARSHCQQTNRQNIGCGLSQLIKAKSNQHLRAGILFMICDSA